MLRLLEINRGEKMIFVGDVHGKILELLSLTRTQRIGENKLVFQVGDMGIGFKGVNLPKTENLTFIRGNHDGPKDCREHPNYAGDYGYLEKEDIFFLGGAWSIDWQYRIEDISWWRDEELDIVELNKAQNLYLEKKPRIVVTHEAPSAAAISLLSGLTLPAFTGDNPTNVKKDEAYGYYKAKLGCVTTRTSQVLQQMFELHQPEHWIFGHYHFTKDFEINGTKFHCLAELDKLELPTGEHGERL